MRLAWVLLAAGGGVALSSLFSIIGGAMTQVGMGVAGGVLSLIFLLGAVATPKSLATMTYWLVLFATGFVGLIFEIIAFSDITSRGPHYTKGGSLLVVGGVLAMLSLVSIALSLGCLLFAEECRYWTEEDSDTDDPRRDRTSDAPASPITPPSSYGTNVDMQHVLQQSLYETQIQTVQNQLPSITPALLDDHSIIPDDLGCAICLERLEKGQAIVELNCGHLLHQKPCSSDWFADPTKTQCPICRHDQRLLARAGASPYRRRAQSPAATAAQQETCPGQSVWD